MNLNRSEPSMTSIQNISSITIFSLHLFINKLKLYNGVIMRKKVITSFVYIDENIKLFITHT